jgi:hypothetical protein
MSTASASAADRLRPILRLLLLSTSVSVVVAVIQMVRSSGLSTGMGALVLVVMLGAVAFVGARLIGGRMRQRAAVRRVEELLRFFDDLSLLRPRAEAARALLAGAPSNDTERRALHAVSQWLGTLAEAVRDAPPEGRSTVFAHPLVGAWMRALAVTTITLPLDAAQRAALAPLQRDLGAAADRRDGLDAGSRALLERDAVLFRPEEAAERVF